MSWREATATELQRRLDMAGAQTPVLVSRSDYLALGGALPPGTPPVHPRGSEVPDLHPAEAFQGALPEGILFSDDIVLLLPQPFVACVPDVMAVSIDATRLPARAAPHP